MALSRSGFVFFLLMLIPLPATAIVNIEAVRKADMKPGVTGELGMALNAISSSTDEVRTNVNGRLDWIHSGIHNFAVFQGAYNEVNDVKRRRGMAHLRHVQSLGDPLASSPYNAAFNWEVFAQSARDDYSTLRWRSLTGAGLRYNHFFNHDIEPSIGVGAFSEWREEEGDAGTIRTNVGRGNIYLGLDAEVSDRLDIGATAYFQPKLNDLDDFSAIGEFFVERALTDHVSLRFIANAMHDSNPPAGVNSTRQEYGVRLVYEFGD